MNIRIFAMICSCWRCHWGQDQKGCRLYSGILPGRLIRTVMAKMKKRHAIIAEIRMSFVRMDRMIAIAIVSPYQIRGTLVRSIM